MYQLIFRNWKFAGLWAIGTMASVGAYFADGGGPEKLDQAAAQAAAHQTAVAAPEPAVAASEGAKDDGFTSDQELSGESEAAEVPAIEGANEGAAEGAA